MQDFLKMPTIRFHAILSPPSRGGGWLGVYMYQSEGPGQPPGLPPSIFIRPPFPASVKL